MGASRSMVFGRCMYIYCWTQLTYGRPYGLSLFGNLRIEFSVFRRKKTASHLTFLALRYQSRIRTKKMISVHAKSILGFKNCNFTTKHQKQNLIAPLSCSQQKHQNKISLQYVSMIFFHTVPKALLLKVERVP